MGSLFINRSSMAASLYFFVPVFARDPHDLSPELTEDVPLLGFCVNICPNLNIWAVFNNNLALINLVFKKDIFDFDMLCALQAAHSFVCLQ